ncbi:MAG: DUF4340 domain-containing protein [Burkholderiales bacterium]
MRANPRSFLNIALLVLVAAAGAILYFRPDPKPAERYAILPTALESVRRIELERARGMRIVLTRESGQWRMQTPVPGRLEAIALARVLDIGRAQTTQRIPAYDLARFELDEPWARVRFDSHVIEFGMSNPLTQELYVRSGEHVYALPARYSANLPGDASKLLAHRLFDPGEQPVAFRLERFSVREEGGRWRLEPGGEAASQDDLLRWVDHWRLASSIITQPQTDARARGSIEVDLRDGRTIRFRVTATTPDLVLRREDERLEYHFPSRLAGVLLASPEALADKKP